MSTQHADFDLIEEPISFPFLSLSLSQADELEDEIEKSPLPHAPPPERLSSTAQANPKSQPSHLEREIDSKTVFASRIDRIAALKKRLGLTASTQSAGVSFIFCL